MAAHGRHDERPGAERLEMGDDRPDDRGDVGDPPAAGRNGHRLAGLDFPVQLQARELPCHFARHVGDAFGIERLAEAEDLGEGGGHGCHLGVYRPGLRGVRAAGLVRLSSEQVPTL